MEYSYILLIVLLFPEFIFARKAQFYGKLVNHDTGTEVDASHYTLKVSRMEEQWTEDPSGNMTLQGRPFIEIPTEPGLSEGRPLIYKLRKPNSVFEYTIQEEEKNLPKRFFVHIYKITNEEAKKKSKDQLLPFLVKTVIVKKSEMTPANLATTALGAGNNELPINVGYGDLNIILHVELINGIQEVNYDEYMIKLKAVGHSSNQNFEGITWASNSKQCIRHIKWNMKGISPEEASSVVVSKASSGVVTERLTYHHKLQPMWHGDRMGNTVDYKIQVNVPEPIKNEWMQIIEEAVGVAKTRNAHKRAGKR
ncbi:hypothetical protein DdX_21415 [Ditylenchus destructor]|uniref:Uncharacterized protein n=1 Tax=Ditylenchus destructor TaxID=166010 RepID=A0AAD4MEW9_9BILA|nr:hypothetical protein DdX_21415 [Ditylenchus destructor]